MEPTLSLAGLNQMGEVPMLLYANMINRSDAQLAFLPTVAFDL